MNFNSVPFVPSWNSTLISPQITNSLKILNNNINYSQVDDNYSLEQIMELLPTSITYDYMIKLFSIIEHENINMNLKLTENLNILKFIKIIPINKISQETITSL